MRAAGGRAVLVLAAVAALGGGAVCAQTSRPAGVVVAREGEAEWGFQRGKLEYARKNYGEAEKLFRQVVAADEKDGEARYFLGLTLAAGGKGEEAVGEFDRAIAIDPGFTEARVGKVDALIRLKRLEDARAEVHAVRQQAGMEATADLLEGRILYAEGRYKEAAGAFAAARKGGGEEAGAASLYEGMTNLQLGRTSAARAAFRDVLDRNPSLAAGARQLEQQLGPDTKNWSVGLSLGYEYDTNVALLESGVQLPGDISNRSDGRVVVQPRASYSFIRNERWDIGVDTANYFSWQHQVSDYDLASYDVGAFVNYKPFERADVYVGFRYDFNFVELGHDPYLKRNLVTPQVTWLQKNVGFVSAYGQFDVRQFDTGEGSLDRDGKYYAAGVLQSIDLPGPFTKGEKSRVELNYRYERQETEGRDFRSHVNTAGVTYYVPLPVWKLRLDAGVAVSLEDYEEANSLDAGGDERFDFEWRPSVGISRAINEHASVRVDYTYTNHNSNVRTAGGDTPYEYDRHVVGVTLELTY